MQPEAACGLPGSCALMPAMQAAHEPGHLQQRALISVLTGIFRRPRRPLLQIAAVQPLHAFAQVCRISLMLE